ncbi:MAG: enolase C-terminal domain-like protein [Brevundimonas sp.]
MTNGKAAMARIVVAEIFEVEAAFAKPYGLSKNYGVMTTARAVMLKLVDEDGIVGWGEANSMQPFTPESPKEAAKVLRETLLPAVMRERNPEPGPVDLLLDGAVAHQLCAKGAVSMALLDIQGHRQGVSVATLLGGALRRSLPVLWPLGTGTAEDDALVIEERAPQGFETYMLKMGDAAVEREVARVAELARRYGSRFNWIADANQGWSMDEAARFLEHATGQNLAFVEQPVAAANREGLASLQASTSFPISADESLLGLSEAAELARLGSARIFSVKSSKNGGPLRAQRVAAVGEAFGIDCYMNSMLEFGITQAASLHHAATVRNLVDVGHAYMSTLRLAEDPTDFESFVRQGRVELPTGPGLGIQVDEEHVRRLSVASHRVAASE